MFWIELVPKLIPNIEEFELFDTVPKSASISPYLILLFK